MSTNLAKSTMWVTVSEIIFNLSGFAIHAVVGRILGPADYGRYGLVVTLATMVIILIGNGIPTAMSKYISEIFESNPRMIGAIKRQSIILQSLIVGIITLIFFFSAPLIAWALKDPTLTPLFRISSLIIPAFAAASFYFSYFTGLHKFNIQAFLKILRSIFKIAFIISLAFLFRVKGSILGYVAAPLAVFIVAYLIDKFKVARELRTNEKQPEITFDWRVLVNYAWQIVIFFLAYELLISIDLYLVKGILRDDHSTGIYNASLTVGRIPYYLFYALTVILLPVISKSTAEKNEERTSTVINQSLRLMLIFLVPAVILMSVFAPEIIQLFYSSAYLDAALPMSILVWGVGFLTIFYVFCFVMSGAGRVKTPMIISFIGFVLNIVLNYFFIKNYGITGSAIATSITSAVITFIMLYYIWKDFQVKITFKSFSKIVLAGLIMYISSLFFSAEPIIFIAWSAILLAIYFFILYLFKEIKNEDIGYLANIFRKKEIKQ